MNVSGPTVQKHVARPSHSIPRKYVEPILYLADRMSQQDRIVPPPSKRMVDQIAEAVKMRDFRRQSRFRGLSDQRACEQIDLETAKLATLVVLSLVMKYDTTRGENAKGYFTKVRELLGQQPVAVPAELDQHRDLALRYLGG